MYGLVCLPIRRDARATLARRRTTRVVGVGVGVDGATFIPSSSSCVARHVVVVSSRERR
jgi:hypothetical protein|tara:strand:- start:5658 stop:5834 length:177 start_codon:yes stop_codon:yes gene_type:complete